MIIREECKRIEELTDNILINERAIDKLRGGFFFAYEEKTANDATLNNMDFHTVRQLEIQNEVMREELRRLLTNSL